MTTESFRSLPSPNGLDLCLKALWHDGRGEWEAAHDLAQQEGSLRGHWVHAYLHRKEGDIGNAGYWYRRAGREMPGPELALSEEWERIVGALLVGLAEDQSRKR